MEYVLRSNKLTKKYAGQAVVDEVSLNVQKGDIYGFVGKNGAGKTTFIRLILGLAEPTSGSFELLSGSLRDARRRTGSLVEAPALYGNMTAAENLRLYCRMLSADPSQIPQLLETVGLEDTGKKHARDFSLGMKQRLGIAMALVGDPEFLILDEPINGLDPTGIVEVRELMLSLQSRGKTIFISSHILGELEKIATRYGIIANGRLVEELSSAELAAKCTDTTDIKTSDPEKTARLLREVFGFDKIELTADGVIKIADKIDNIGLVTNELFKNDIVVAGITTSGGSAEKYFIRQMGERVK